MKSNTQTKTAPKRKWWIIVIIILAIVAAGGGVLYWWFNHGGEEIITGIGEGGNHSEPIYSNFTGLEIADAALNSAPTYCVQIPNGSTDGARPQAGLTQAGVVFEAIAEAGITRFAAIFQNPETGVIGPIRSLRPYYLDWDTPFDCTVVHDGGSHEALQAIAQGGQRNLDENFNYMWKVQDSSRLWNNVFTSPEKIMEFNLSKNYQTSAPKTFPRYEPTELADLGSTNNDCTEDTEDCVDQSITHIRTAFTNQSYYIVNYTYDRETNSYRRAYETGGEHLVYNCPVGVTDFSACGELVQVAPTNVVVMRVQESTMADNYHEQIQTVGQGKAYIFQNGQMIEGTWQKVSQDRQIEFKDAAGQIVKFVPGQIWIAAVPQFGSVSWE